MKKCISSLLVCALFFMMCTSAFAQAPTAQPRWAELSSVQTCMENYSGIYNNAKVGGAVTSRDGYSKLNLTVTVMKWNGSNYAATDKSWSSSGTGATELTQYCRLDAGNYIARITVSVYSSTGNHIETVTYDSNDIVI